METTNNQSKKKRIIYWIATVWLCLGMTSTGIVQLIRMPQEVENMTQLGYPVYVLGIIGVCKLLGVIAVLVPGYPLIKEWAYAGFFFVMCGATYSHVAVRDPVSEIYPTLLLLTLTITSWYFRPANRKPVPLQS